MAKKSSNRQRPAAHAKGSASTKPQSSTATLVRAATPTTGADTGKATAVATTTTSSPAASSIVRDKPATAVATTKPAAKPAPKPAAPAKATAPTTSAPAAAKTAAPAAKPAPTAPGKRQDTRVARARATQRARQAGMISAENYSYVLGDLKLVAVLATAAFAILIALAFFLPR